MEVQAGSRGKRLPVPPPPLPPPPPLALRGGEAWRQPPVCRCALRFGGDLLRKCGCMSTWCGAAREGWPARRPVSKRAWRTAASLSTIRSLYGDEAIATQQLAFYPQHHQLHFLVLYYGYLWHVKQLATSTHMLQLSSWKAVASDGLIAVTLASTIKTRNWHRTCKLSQLSRILC